MADLEKLENSLDQMISLMVSMKESLQDKPQNSQDDPQLKAQQKEPEDLQSNFNNFEKLKEALNSEKWPEAVNPNLICDPNSEDDKNERGRGVIELMIEEDLKGLKVLDFGCGEGHCVKISSEYETVMSAGYDIKENQKWSEFQKENVLFSNDWNKIKEHAPYDIVILFDVIDHLKGQTGCDILSQIKDVLADNGKIYMRCHPFVSRHATHLYHELNKAYIHLVFTEDELKQLVPDSKHFEESTCITSPLRTYGDFIDKAGLKIINRRDITEKVEPFFKIPQIAERIINNTKHGSYPEFQMTLQFIDYKLEK